MSIAAIKIDLFTSATAVISGRFVNPFPLPNKSLELGASPRFAILLPRPPGDDRGEGLLPSSTTALPFLLFSPSLLSLPPAPGRRLAVADCYRRVELPHALANDPETISKVHFARPRGIIRPS